jgi:hypothetical protein
VTTGVDHTGSFIVSTSSTSTALDDHAPRVCEVVVDLLRLIDEARRGIDDRAG